MKRLKEQLQDLLFTAMEICEEYERRDKAVVTLDREVYITLSTGLVVKVELVDGGRLAISLEDKSPITLEEWKAQAAGRRAQVEAL